MIVRLLFFLCINIVLEYRSKLINKKLFYSAARLMPPFKWRPGHIPCLPYPRYASAYTLSQSSFYFDILSKLSSAFILSLSLSLILSIDVQEKHHFIIQIRLILNCLKPRTEFKLETARSSPHDRRFSSSFTTLRGDRLSSSILFYSLSEPFIVETHLADICFRARCRFPANATYRHYKSIIYHIFL